MNQFSILFTRPVDNTPKWIKVIKWAAIVAVVLTPGALLGAWIYHLIAEYMI